MADTQSYQSKLKRLVFDSETTTGTAEVPDASSYVVPAFDISMARDRGTGIIARDAVLDGFAGEMCGVPGTFGSTLSFSSEIHPVNGESAPYFVRLLQGCGFSGSVSATAVTMAPSAHVVQNYAACEPNSLTFSLIHLLDNINDTRQTMTGSTGNVSFVLNAGERAQMDFTFVGKNGAFMEFAGDMSTTGSVTEIGCTPFVVKGITAAMVGPSAETFDEVQLSSLTINMNAETPDIIDPTEADGFAVSPVFYNGAPTVSFQIGATATNNTRFWSFFKAGTPISLDVTITDSATSNTVRWLIDQVQFTGLSMADNNGAESYQVEGKVVRDAGEDYNTSGSRCQFIWTFA